MNERIKQLAEQADWYKPIGLPSNWDEEDYIVSPEQMRKFAELIVRECLSHTKDGDIDFMKFMIRKHFGVEE
jgi:hypothetical protein